jgi:hypothetical protein
MHRRLPGVLLVLVAATALDDARAGLVSREFQFKAGTILEVGAETPERLRIDNVRFDAPSKVSGKLVRLGGVFEAEVAVSNGGNESARAGIAIALFDDEGRLVGAASGGSKVVSIKPGRQKSFTLVFDGVTAEAERATRFHITLETKP